MMLLVGGASWDALPAEAAPPDTSYYLSVGDSLAWGYQPVGQRRRENLADVYVQGYANQLIKTARGADDGTLRLVKLGCGGETSGLHDQWQPAATTTPGLSSTRRSEFLDTHLGRGRLHHDRHRRQ